MNDAPIPGIDVANVTDWFTQTWPGRSPRSHFDLIAGSAPASPSG